MIVRELQMILDHVDPDLPVVIDNGSAVYEVWTSPAYDGSGDRYSPRGWPAMLRFRGKSWRDPDCGYDPPVRLHGRFRRRRELDEKLAPWRALRALQ